MTGLTLSNPDFIDFITGDDDEQETQGSGSEEGQSQQRLLLLRRSWWFVLNEGKKVPLCYDDGERIRNKDESPKVVDEAYHRWWQSKKEERNRTQEDAPNPIAVREVVNAYLTYAKRHAAPKWKSASKMGSPALLVKREKSLLTG